MDTNYEKIDTRRTGYVVEYRETRVYTKEDRSRFYKTWLSEKRTSHRGTNRYRLVSKAYERVIQALEAEDGLVEHFPLVDDDGNPQYSRRLKDKGVRES
ncbi:MAG: hypothetical protein GX350_00855 [Erysipelotrichaceae bacterium]|nr:hypothetical protein [Erysipelotrichaceae bacterium]